jgi:hypothetical protein
MCGRIIKCAPHDVAIKASEQRFRDIAETAGDWIYEMDANLRFTYISGRFFDPPPLGAVPAGYGLRQAQNDTNRLHQLYCKRMSPSSCGGVGRAHPARVCSFSAKPGPGGRPACLPACLQARAGRHRVEATGLITIVPAVRRIGLRPRTRQRRL